MTHDLIKWLRENGVTQKDFCGDIGLSTQTLLRVRDGSTPITTDVIRRIAEGTGFEVTEERLFALFIDARARLEAAASGGSSIKTTDISVSCEFRP